MKHVSPMKLATPQQCLLLVMHNQFKKGTLPESKIPVYQFMKRKHSPTAQANPPKRKLDPNRRINPQEVMSKNMRELLAMFPEASLV